MRRKVFYLVIIIAVTTFCLSACNENKTVKKEVLYSPTKPTIAVSPTPSVKPQNIMTKQFMEDAKLPTEIYEKFATAIHGDMNAQEWIGKYVDENKSVYFSALNTVLPTNFRI